MAFNYQSVFALQWNPAIRPPRQGGGTPENSAKRWNFCFCRNLNLKVLKFILRNISDTVSSKLVFSKQVILPLRKVILTKICLIDLKFSGLYPLINFIQARQKHR